jgi:hypothetical protein
MKLSSRIALIAAAALGAALVPMAAGAHSSQPAGASAPRLAVVNVLTISDGKVSGVSGYFSDVASFDGYFS